MNFDYVKKLYESITPVNERVYGTSRDIRPIDRRGNKTIRVHKVSHNEYSIVTSYVKPDPSYPSKVNRELKRGLSFFKDGTVELRWPCLYYSATSRLVRHDHIQLHHRYILNRYLPGGFRLCLSKGYLVLRNNTGEFILPEDEPLRLSHDGNDWRVVDPELQTRYNVSSLREFEKQKLSEFYKYADAMRPLVDVPLNGYFRGNPSLSIWPDYVGTETVKTILKGKSLWLDVVKMEKWLAENTWYGRERSSLFNSDRRNYRKALARLYKNKFAVGKNPYGVVTAKHWIERGV